MRTLREFAGLALLTSSLIFPSKSSAEGNTSINGRFAWAPRYNSLELIESKTVQPHPDDSGFVSGAARVKADNGFEIIPLRFGVEANAEYGAVALTAGVDFGLSLDGQIADAKSDMAMADFKQQPGDGRSSGKGSFAYDKVSRDFLEMYPFIGLTINTSMGRFGTEASLPYLKFRREWGHHRFGEEDKIGSEKLDADGLGIRLTWVKPESAQIGGAGGGVEVLIERYNLEGRNTTEGEINSYSVGMFTKF